MKSSLGSDAFILIALGIIALAVLLLLRHYLPLRSTPTYLTVPVFLALVLPLSILLLVPIDLASSSRTAEGGARAIWLPDGVILVAWRLMYWLTFALTWFILPLLGEYVDSGYRTPKDRVLYSLRSNGRYQLIIFLCAAAAAIYVFLINGFKGASVKSLVMALAYCWGLVMAIYLMGHGLVSIPRKLFQDANLNAALHNHYGQAPGVKDRLDDATMELEELELQLAQLRRRKNAVSRDHEEWIEEISAGMTRGTGSLPSATSTPALPAVLTDRYLADFSRRLIRARHKQTRFTETWHRLIGRCERAQILVDAAESKKMQSSEDPQGPWLLGGYAPLSPYTRYLLHVKVVPALEMSLGAVLGLASVCIVWSEFVKNLAPKLSIVSLTALSHRNDEVRIGFGGQVVASVWLLYMSVATLSSFEDVKIWGNRALVRRNTYGESATWYSAQIAKLTVPLTYNFITFLPKDVYKETQYFRFLGTLINLTPLGKYFDYFFPMFILVPVCITLFNLYGRVKRVLGFGIIDDEEGGTGGSWREGRDLVAREQQNSERTGFASYTDGTSSPRRSNTDGISHAGGGSTAPVTHSRPNVDRQSSTAQRQAQRLADATAAAEEEDEGLFQGFAHRFKNTIDSVERPEWMNELGRRPKWMGQAGGEDSESGAGRGLARWFGGRSEGQVRL